MLKNTLGVLFGVCLLQGRWCSRFVLSMWSQALLPFVEEVFQYRFTGHQSPSQLHKPQLFIALQVGYCVDDASASRTAVSPVSRHGLLAARRFVAFDSAPAVLLLPPRHWPPFLYCCPSALAL